IRAGADEEARRHHDRVVVGLRVDVLHAVDAFDDGLERLRDEFDGVLRLEAVGLDAHVDHRYGYLRLLFARKRHKRDEAERERGEQQKRRQRRADEGPREEAGKPESHGRITRSPSRRPVITSTRGSSSLSENVSPKMTGTSCSPCAIAMRM